MRPLLSVCLVSWLALTACRNTGDGPPVDANFGFPVDDEILAKAYDSSYDVPDGFFVDDRAGTTRSYTIYHVKDASVSYELCTDDLAEALEWEAADNLSRSVNGLFVTLVENSRYYEVVRELAYPDSIGNISDPTSPGYSRVFKCAYVNRNGVDRNLREGYAGMLNQRPLSREVLRDFVEYMWQFTFFWPAKKAVLESFSFENDDAFEHTLRLAFVTSQGSGECDLVEVVDWVFTLDKVEGQIERAFNLRYQLRAQVVNGTPRLCGE